MTSTNGQISASTEKNSVQLAPGSLIDCWDLTRAIAKAICPSLREAKGSACVKSKRELVSSLGMVLDRPLTNEDREKLDRLLPDLPALRGEISNSAATAFIHAYMNHPGHFSWEPVFFSETDVMLNAFAITEIQDDHRKKLQEYVSSGKFKAVDRRHLPTLHAVLGSYILREDAVKYLRDHLLHLTEPAHPLPREAELPSGQHDEARAATSNVLLQETSNSSGGLLETPTPKGKRGNTLYWTPERLEELEGMARASVSATAEHFGFTPRWLRVLREKHRKATGKSANPERSKATKSSDRYRNTPFPTQAKSRMK